MTPFPCLQMCTQTFFQTLWIAAKSLFPCSEGAGKVMVKIHEALIKHMWVPMEIVREGAPEVAA